MFYSYLLKYVWSYYKIYIVFYIDVLNEMMYAVHNFLICLLSLIVIYSNIFKKLGNIDIRNRISCFHFLNSSFYAVEFFVYF